MQTFYFFFHPTEEEHCAPVALSLSPKKIAMATTKNFFSWNGDLLFDKTYIKKAIEREEREKGWQDFFVADSRCRYQKAEESSGGTTAIDFGGIWQDVMLNYTSAAGVSSAEITGKQYDNDTPSPSLEQGYSMDWLFHEPSAPPLETWRQESGTYDMYCGTEDDDERSRQWQPPIPLPGSSLKETQTHNNGGWTTKKKSTATKKRRLRRKSGEWISPRERAEEAVWESPPSPPPRPSIAMIDPYELHVVDDDDDVAACRAPRACFLNHRPSKPEEEEPLVRRHKRSKAGDDETACIVLD